MGPNKEVKLHLGCGSKILDGFINIDIRDMEGVDVVDDIGCLDSFDNGTATLIYACHVLEHVGRHDRLGILKRWHTVLSTGGILRLSVPDFEKIVQLYNEGVVLDNLIGMLYGGQDSPYNFHKYTWDLSSITHDLKNAGFDNIRKYEWRKTEHAEVDDYSQAYYPHMRKDTGLLISLNVEATKTKG